MNRVAPFTLGVIGTAMLAVFGSLGCSQLGGSSAGILDDGTPAPAESDSPAGNPAEPQPLIAAGIAVGKAHSCARLVDGTVACWGRGDVGQLGDGMWGED